MNSKTTMLAAALVVGIVALAGVGYAVTLQGYTAKTTNDNNTMSSEYIVLTQTAGNTYGTNGHNLFKGIEYDTVNTVDATTISYIPVKTHQRTEATENDPVIFSNSGADKDYALVTESLTLTLNRVGTAATTYKVEIGISNCVTVAGLTYTMVIGTEAVAGTIRQIGAGAITYSNGGATCTIDNVAFTFDNNSTEFNVYLFASGQINSTTSAPVTNIATGGFNVGDADSAFTFTVTPYE